MHIQIHIFLPILSPNCVPILITILIHKNTRIEANYISLSYKKPSVSACGRVNKKILDRL